MKKILMTMAVAGSLMGFAGTSNATVSILWAASNGIDSPAVPGVANDLPLGSLVLLIYSPLNTLSALNPATPTAVNTGVGEIVLSSDPSNTAGAFVFGPNNFGSGVQFEGGYAYIRVFSSAAPTAGDYYFETTVANMSQSPLPNSSTPVFVDAAPSSVVTLNQQIVVPEPTTIAFLLAGVGMIAYRRFRRS